MTYLKYRSSGGRLACAFLGTSQEGGDEPRERKRGRTTSKKKKENQTQMQSYKIQR
jgi:hypothetical protein